MVNLSGTISRLGYSKVLVIGDILLDTYTIGKAKRISPEAPVAIIQVLQEESRPGGAGNVALNLVSLGTEVVVMARIGHDSAGETLYATLKNEGVNVRGLVTQQGYRTPVKNRIIAENQQIVRVDHEQITSIPELLEQQVIEQLPELLEGVKVVAISDYGKGFLSRTLLSAVLEQAKRQGIPVIADPKGIDFSKYSGATVLKPNLAEAYAAANLTADMPLEIVAQRVLQISQVDVLMITRSEAGISLFFKDGSRHDFPVKMKEVKDVTGAGDTVLATLTCALANNLTITEAAQLSNIAAGIAIERFGCARITLSELARRLLEYDVSNKVFDDEHLFALQEALRGHRFALLAINGERGLTSQIFSAIRQLAHEQDQDLLVYVRDQNPSEEFVNILSALNDVDFIILKEESLRNLCGLIHPREIYLIENQMLKKLHVLQDLLEEAKIEE
jgi:rfaE bifunctional protein kinase chain/domain